MSAHVRRISVIRDFRARLIRFAEEVEGALLSVQSEIQRASEWIEQDRPRYWTVQVQKAFDQVAAARTALNTCQMRTVAGRRPSCIEEKQALASARRRLQHCQEQIERVKRWSTKIRHESDEFRGRLAGLRRLLEFDIPRALLLLERTADVLEAYADIDPAGTQES
jgi:hypothetical protein